ncbi:hypothetical protein A3A55_03630 [Candidatus Roizmanbacteria bacterium RIFCSPLOWO2_01_FULL_40_14]|nr:MAG: hypothetical protein A3A55_03630 [Candidatus Roizmanbacteria bacterium RIFCSPLOWO2_01_FULL_40_14]
MLTRNDLKKLSQLRLKEAKKLLIARHYSGSYYLAGYVIECALKAYIARKTRKSEFPDIDAVKASYTHNPENLIGAAGLKTQLNSKIKSEKSFQVKWTTVIQWSEKSRYEIHTKKEAEDLLTAIEDPKGVLKWIQKYW